MSDLQKYLNKRKHTDAEFANGFDEGYQSFKISAILKQAREASGLTQTQIADKLHTKKSTINRVRSRIATLQHN